jgi:hypothetical protein
MIGFFLNIIAGISLWLLRRIGWVYGALTTKDFNKYNRDIALAKDQLGNVILAPLLNKLLITKAGYKFGNRKETISGVIGKNYLTFRSNNILDKITLIKIILINYLKNYPFK